MMDGASAALLDRTRLLQFATVGVLGTGVDLSISVPLVMLTDTPAVLAKFLGAEAAIIVMFFVNDRWTFGAVETSGWSHRLRRLLKSNLVRGGGLSVQLIVVFLLTRTDVAVVVSGIDVWPALTMPIAIACGFLVNYTGETLLTWRTHR